MKPKLTLLSYLFLSLFFISCDKLLLEEEEEDPQSCSSLTPLKITIDNNPVASGSSFQLMLNKVTVGSTYNWTGPNGFVSQSEQPTIPQALSSHAGKYSVEEVTPYGCRLKATSDSVIVTQATAPCSPANNTASIAASGSMNFYSMSGAPSGGSYFITGHSTGGDIELEFPGTAKPVAGVYNIRSLGSQWLTGDVRLRLVGSSSNWPASSGKLYVTVTNNKVKAYFCSVPVFAQTWGVNSTATGHITEL